MSITFDATQQAAVDSTSPVLQLLFTVTQEDSTVNYWSWIVTDYQYDKIEDSLGGYFEDGLGGYLYFGQQFTYKVPFDSFKGIDLNRLQTENNQITPSKFSFDVVNPSDALTASDFDNAAVRLQVIINDVEIRAFTFWTQSCAPDDQVLHFECRDPLQRYIKGDYPNTRMVRDIFPADDADINDNLCCPEVFGMGYVPTRSDFISGDGRYYLLGPTTRDYHIHAVSSPHQLGGQSEWDVTGYTFPQYTKNDGADDWRVFRPLIANGAPCFWQNGSYHLDMPTKLSFADYGPLTGPHEVVGQVVQNMGMPADDIDLGESFVTAGSTYSTRSLEFNGGAWYKEDRQKYLAELLNSCNSTLDPNELLELRVLSADSVDVKAGTADITSDHILDLNPDRKGSDSFEYKAILQDKPSDSGHVAWQQDGKPQDVLRKDPVAATSTIATLSNDTFSTRWVQDSQQVQKLTALWLQKRLLKTGQGSLVGTPPLLVFQPDDFVTITGDEYGVTRTVRIDRMFIGSDLAIKIYYTEFKKTLSSYDWDALAPSAITPATDTTTIITRPVVSGNESTPTSGNPPNEIRGGSVVVADDGAVHSKGKTSFADDTEGFWIGYNPATSDYRFNLGDGDVFVKMYAGAIHQSVSSISAVDGNATVSGFSTDGTMAANSDSLVPVQSAVVTADATTLSLAQTYADAGDAATLASAQAYATAADVVVLASAQTYADGVLTAHTGTYNHDNYDTAYGWGDHASGGYLLIANIDDTPVDGELNAPISSNWAFDHDADADAHHAESHDVVSHSDTTATGAELDTLTDDSMADALHRHSELSAADGAPDPAVQVDNDGKVGVGAAALTNEGDVCLLKDGVLAMKETTTPTADTNYGKVYTKTDNKLYFQDGAGAEHEISFVP